MMKRFKVFYKGERRKFPLVTPFKGYEFVEAENIAKAKAIAEEHAKDAGWYIDMIKEETFDNK